MFDAEIGIYGREILSEVPVRAPHYNDMAVSGGFFPEKNVPRLDLSA